MLGPFPRSLSRIDGGVASATTYLSQSLAVLPNIELIGVRLGGRAITQGITEDLGWPVVNCELGRLSVSSMFYLPRRRFSAILNRFRPDIVHSQGTDAAGFLAVRSGYPTVITVHGILTECAKYRINPIARWREKAQAMLTEQQTIQRTRHVIAINPYVTTYYKDRLRATIYEVPNAVPQSYFGLRRQPTPGRVLFAGRVSRGKGVMDLVRALTLVPEAAEHVVIAGASPDAEFERQLRHDIAVSGFGERFRLSGLLPEEMLLEEFSRAAALVLPSYQETAPMVIQQAMAAGLPVVASRVGGIPHQIEHGVSGLLFEPGDVKDLARQLLHLRNDPELGLRLAEAAKRIATENFSADRVARATLSVYESVLAGD